MFGFHNVTGISLVFVFILSSGGFGEADGHELNTSRMTEQGLSDTDMSHGKFDNIAISNLPIKSVTLHTSIRFGSGCSKFRDGKPIMDVNGPYCTICLKETSYQGVSVIDPKFLPYKFSVSRLYRGWGGSQGNYYAADHVYVANSTSISDFGCVSKHADKPTRPTYAHFKKHFGQMVTLEIVPGSKPIHQGDWEPVPEEPNARFIRP